jgi:MFS family permease
MAGVGDGVGQRSSLLVFSAKAVRTFCYGFLGILLPLHLSDLGMGGGGIGAGLTLVLAASAALTWMVRRPAERHGATAPLIGLAALSVLAATLLLITRDPRLVIAAAMLGNVAVGGGETGPFLTLEQVVISRAVAPARLASGLSLYNLVGYVAAALGAAAAAALPARGLFWIFLGGAIIQIAAYAQLRVDGRPIAGRAMKLASLPSASIIRRLAALFALDSLAGGFVLQSIIVYWFHVRFGLGLAALGPVFFAVQIVTALSFLGAARLADRFGLVNTMVFTHLASNVFLVSIAFSPSAPVAIAFLLARHLLSQMDVPTRQAYVMSVVEDHEREAAATVTNLSRTVAQAVTPAVTGPVMQLLAVSAPFVLGGGLKIVYDLLLYATLRRLPPRRST